MTSFRRAGRSRSGISLTHMAGISYGSGPARDLWTKATIQGRYFADREEPVGATIARMASLPFDAQPGERWIYGYATDILGVVVEKASGMPLDGSCARAFEPLAMRDTHFYVPARRRQAGSRPSIGASRPWTAAGAGVRRDERTGAVRDGPRKSFSGGAGLVSTATTTRASSRCS